MSVDIENMKEHRKIKTNKPIGLRNNILVQELEKELLLYDLSRDKVFCLNETSSLIWNLCDGENSIEDIRQKISLRLRTNISEEIIWLALDKLKTEQLLSNHGEIVIDFNNLSRREVIKRAGLSTMVALPLVLSIISPSAVNAASQVVCETLTGCVCNFALVCNIFGAGHIFSGSCVNTFCGTAGSMCQCAGPLTCIDSTFAAGNCATA